MKKLLSTISAITILGSIAIGFQNCAEEVNMDQYKTSESSSTNTPASAGPVLTVDPNPSTVVPAPVVLAPVVNNPAVITSYPTSTQSVTFESPFSIAVTATGDATVSYTWYKNNSVRLADDGRISGTSTSALRISSAVDADSGSYTVEARNSYGVDSKTITVQVSRTANQRPPALAVDGGLKDLRGGVTIDSLSSRFSGAWIMGNLKAKATFTITLSNTTNVAYQWYKIDQYNRESLIAGQTGATYSFVVGASNYASAGGKYRVVATNPYGSLTSEAVLHLETTNYISDYIYGI